MIRHLTGKAVGLYQSGADRSKAVDAGVAAEFDRLESEFKGASIPLHLLRGFKYVQAYSCEYHTGGAAGVKLRELCK